MLKNILAITGKPGLYRLVSRGNNMLIIESLEDCKRMPTYAHDKVVSLADISMFTEGDDIPLHDVLEKLKNFEKSEPVKFDIKKASNDELRSYFAQIVPDFDRDRVYPSDIRKLLLWYNILVKTGNTDFSVSDENEAESVLVEDKVEKAEHKVNTKSQVKTQKSSAVTVKTGVGAKRG